jgi:hypothetical protein
MMRRTLAGYCCVISEKVIVAVDPEGAFEMPGIVIVGATPATAGSEVVTGDAPMLTVSVLCVLFALDDGEGKGETVG